MGNSVRRGYYYRIRDLPETCSVERLKKSLQECYTSLKLDEIDILSLSVDAGQNIPTKVAIISFRKSLHTESTLKSSKAFCYEDERLELDAEFEGLTPLYKSSKSPQLQTTLDIFVVHGLGGHAMKSFMHGEIGNTYFWPLEKLSSQISSAQVWLWGYSSELVNSKSFQNLDDLANLFADCLCSDENVVQDRACILVGVSLGGLIVKRAIKILKDMGKDDAIRRIAHLIMFGVPSQGMHISNMQKLVEDQSNESLIRSLDSSSLILDDLRHDFARAFPFADSRVYSFYETKQTPNLKKDDNGRLVESDEPPVVLVSKQSATHGRWEAESGPEFVKAINKDHRNIAKFSRSEESLKRVMLVIQKCCDDASVIVRKRFATVQFHRIMSKSRDILMISNHNQPFRALTLDLLKNYREIYDTMPHDIRGAISFGTALEFLTDTRPVLSREFEQENSDQITHLPSPSTIERAWRFIKPDKSPLSRNLTLAVLFLIDLDQNGIPIPHSELELDSPSNTIRFTKQRYDILKRFNDWTPCQCSSTCPLEWNFANDTGLSRVSDRAANATNTRAFFSQRPSPHPPSVSFSCDFKRYLDKPPLIATHKNEKIFKETKRAWYMVRGKGGDGDR